VHRQTDKQIDRDREAGGQAVFMKRYTGRQAVMLSDGQACSQSDRQAG